MHLEAVSFLDCRLPILRGLPIADCQLPIEPEPTAPTLTGANRDNREGEKPLFSPLPPVQNRLPATGAWAAVPPANSVRLVTQHGYLPDLPVLVRVEVLTPQGARDWSLWDGEAVLSANSGAVTLSTNRVPMRNGMGSALVAFSGGGDFDLTATRAAARARATRSGAESCGSRATSRCRPDSR